MEIDKASPVMVTGATGYVAGWIVKKLLDEGLTVHAAVRTPDNEEKLRYLNALADVAPGNIKYFKADLLDDGSYDAATNGCQLVMHTASPFTMNVEDPQRDLIDPALNGTRNVLESANRCQSVRRVVLTSSCASIYGDNKDVASAPGGVLTEDIWNTSSSPAHQPYSYSKTVAEEEAWKISREQSRWDLVVMNPALVIGPGINPIGTSESFNYVRQLGDGTMKWGAPDIHFGVVDVRDLAEAHYLGGFTPPASGRHILAAGDTCLLELGRILRKTVGDDYPFPKRTMPKFLVWLIAPSAGMTRKTVSLNMGYPWKADNSKSLEQLGVSYRPIEESITDFFQQLIDNNVVSKR